MRWLGFALAVLLPLMDLAWNLTHLNIGLVDFYGVTLPALGLVQNGAWPATPYFPAGYPLLLIPAGMLGSTLVGGYVLSAIGAMLALTGVRRLALELGAAEEWTLAAIALAWAEPSFRVTAGAPTPDMLMTGIGVWFIWSAVAMWRGSSDTPAADQRRQPWIMAACSFTLPLLRYHAYVLVLPVLALLLAAGKLRFDFRRRPFEPGPASYAPIVLGSLLLAAVINYLPYYVQHHYLPSSAAPLQIRVGLEEEKPTFFTSTDQLFQRYSAFADFARRRSIVRDYGMGTLAKHAASQLGRFLRRPPVALALLLLIIGAFSRRLQRGELLLGTFIVLYSLALAVAYYTPRSALLVVLLGVALCLAVAPRVIPFKTDIVLAVISALLLIAYWPAGNFARANFAQRAQYAQLSRDTAAMLKDKGISPEDYISTDMRIIRLPRLGNPWQKPFLTLDESWLDDPAIFNTQMPGYRDEDGAFSAHVTSDPRGGKSPSDPPASGDSRGQ